MPVKSLEIVDSRLLLFFFQCLQASEEASLRALESLMTEFFHSCTTNERKREIGKRHLSIQASSVCLGKDRWMGILCLTPSPSWN